jgi:NADPH:quinone reductase-like Zn-dependent oxidoreductase
MIGGSMGVLLLQMMVLAPLLSRFSNKKIGIMGYHVNRKDLDTLSRLFEEGKAVPVIDSCFSLQEVPAAFRHFISGKFKGKIVIEVASR